MAQCAMCEGEAVQGRKLCTACQLRAREAQARWSAATLARGLCVSCAKEPPRAGMVTCATCAERKRSRKSPERERERYRRRTGRRSALGLCLCGRDRAEGSARCQECGEKALAKERRRHERARAQGVCSACGGGEALQGLLCADCKAKARERLRRRREERKARGQCAKCPRPALAGTTLCEEHKRRNRASIRKAVYGITSDGMAALLAGQGGACAICRGTDPGGRAGWHVDHDHASGVVRGVLCHHCNTGLGLFRDSEDTLAKAIEYLRRAKVRLAG